MFPHFRNIIKLLFPFKYPMDPATLILGGMLTYMCIWSGHTSPSMISAPFHWHNFLSISRISNLFSSKNTFRLYLGANTMWYLQFHFVCAKLFTMLSCYCIMISSDCVFGDWQVFFYCTQSEFFCLPHRLSLFWTPRLSRGFRFTRKGRCIATTFSLLLLLIFSYLLTQKTVQHEQFRFLYQRKFVDDSFHILLLRF